MCGFAGIVRFAAGPSSEEFELQLSRMRDSLAHRGPDDAGLWIDASAGVGLGHRRLAIVDLSPSGHQPMVSSSGRYVITFNGEIYNFRELRAELMGRAAFRGHSDTEVLLAAVETWGLPAALRRFNGMFAFALWDREERVLSLARDRFGEKPLYYGRAADGALIFGSELKALRAYTHFHGRLNHDSVAGLLRFNYISAPQTIYSGVHKLPAASVLRIAATADIDSDPSLYWSVEELAAAAKREPFRGSFDEAATELDRLLRNAIRLRMVADVPLGAFLSGGIDSSTVVAMMQASAEDRVKTFTIGFSDAAYDEAPEARAVAQHLGTYHTEQYVTSAEAMDVLPRLPTLYDEPFADSSQIPTFLVASLARRHVTVALSGDAGDELFAGYGRYPVTHRAWKKLSRVPGPLRRVVAPALARMPDGLADKLLRVSSRSRLSSGRLRAVSELVPAGNADDLYVRVLSSWQSPGEVVLGARASGDHITTVLRKVREFSAVDRMMLADTLTYLPDDILTKVDRAAMGVGLEARVPLLDPEISRFAWSLPAPMKLSGSEGKIVLRRVLQRYLPEPLFKRPKRGFGVPVESWLRGSLGEWAEAQLNEARLTREGVFAVGPVRKLWSEHKRGARNWQRQLWPILVFQAWLESQD